MNSSAATYGEGKMVLTATGDPAEVLRLVAETRPHLVLLDMALPGADGIELMAEINSLVDVPVIFLSAYGQDPIIARAFDNGAADYVVKPFSSTELAERIGAALRKRNAEASETSEFFPDGVRKYTFDRTIYGVEGSCIGYGWTPKRGDWQKDGKVNVGLVK